MRGRDSGKMESSTKALESNSSPRARAARSQGGTPRRSRRLRGQSPPATPNRKKRVTKKVSRSKLPITKRPRPNAQDEDPDATESDTEIVASVTEAVAMETKIEDGRETSATIMSKMVDLVGRMEAAAKDSEAARARERAEREQAYRNERSETMRLFRETVERTARQIEAVSAAFREAITASAHPGGETTPPLAEREQEDQAGEQHCNVA